MNWSLTGKSEKTENQSATLWLHLQDFLTILSLAHFSTMMRPCTTFTHRIAYIISDNDTALTGATLLEFPRKKHIKGFKSHHTIVQSSGAAECVVQLIMLHLCPITSTKYLAQVLTSPCICGTLISLTNNILTSNVTQPNKVRWHIQDVTLHQRKPEQQSSALQHINNHDKSFFQPLPPFKPRGNQAVKWENGKEPSWHMYGKALLYIL